MIPWIEVLLHTWLDLQIIEEDGRTINHHGTEIDVGFDQKSKVKIYILLFHFYACFDSTVCN